MIWSFRDICLSPSGNSTTVLYIDKNDSTIERTSFLGITIIDVIEQPQVIGLYTYWDGASKGMAEFNIDLETLEWNQIECIATETLVFRPHHPMMILDHDEVVNDALRRLAAV